MLIDIATHQTIRWHRWLITWYSMERENHFPSDSSCRCWWWWEKCRASYFEIFFGPSTTTKTKHMAQKYQRRRCKRIIRQWEWSSNAQRLDSLINNRFPVLYDFFGIFSLLYCYLYSLNNIYPISKPACFKMRNNFHSFALFSPQSLFVDRKTQVLLISAYTQWRVQTKTIENVCLECH